MKKMREKIYIMIVDTVRHCYDVYSQLSGKDDYKLYYREETRESHLVDRREKLYMGAYKYC